VTDPREQVGSYFADETGDYANHSGVASYRKRVIRRLTSREGSFRHLTNYGVGTPDQVKRLARPSVRAQLAVKAEEQFNQEPETLSVKVTIVAVGSVFHYVVAAKMKLGVTLHINVPVSGGFSG